RGDVVRSQAEFERRLLNELLAGRRNKLSVVLFDHANRRSHVLRQKFDVHASKQRLAAIRVPQAVDRATLRPAGQAGDQLSVQLGRPRLGRPRILIVEAPQHPSSLRRSCPSTLWGNQGRSPERLLSAESREAHQTVVLYGRAMVQKDQ